MAAVEHKTLRVDELQVGMYVSRLDRPWIETPFPLQGFYIRDLTDIDQLRRHCRSVTIDLSRSGGLAEPVRHLTPARREAVAPQRHEAAPGLVARPAVSKPAPASAAPAKAVRRPVYQSTVSMPQEVSAARELHSIFADTVASMYQRLAQGRDVDLNATRELTAHVVDSVVRNPDAMVWLSRVRQKDAYSYHHAFRCAIWGAVFGRHLGISKAVLEQLAFGLTVMDVGKARLPAHLLNKSGLLSPAEKAEVRRHVDHSLDILSGMPGMPAPVLQMVAEHHERFDGSGYPRQLTGKAISPLGKIAGLVDTYDAMTSERPYARALTSVEAVSRLYELRNTEFQAQLVEEFIQAIGVYPTGSLVHLSNQEVGVVIAQNPERRLRPKLLVLLDGDKKPVARPHYLDMMSVTHDGAGEPLRIITSLLPGAFGVDPARVQLAA